jgi:hypothetical protein
MKERKKDRGDERKLQRAFVWCFFDDKRASKSVSDFARNSNSNSNSIPKRKVEEATVIRKSNQIVV